MKQSGTKSFILGNLFVVLLFLLSFTNAHAQWAYTYGGAGYDFARVVNQTEDGGYIVAAETNSFGAGNYESWITKLDEDGIVTWQKTYGGSGNEIAYSVQQVQEGGYIVVGRTASFGAGNDDLWILKLDNNGNVTWQKTYGGTGDDGAYSFYQTQGGGYIVVGWTASFGAGSNDIWILKLDVSGNVTWEKTYGGTGYDTAYSVQQTREGGYIVAGRTNSFGAGNDDIWILKLDNNGNVTWQKTYGGAGNEYAFAVRQTLDEGYIVAGYTNSFGAGNDDIWILKLDSNGNVTWQKAYGGTGNDSLSSFDQTQEGGYIVVGGTSSFGSGDSDFWILKLDSSGNIIWEKTYGGAGYDYALSVRQVQDGGYITAGYTNSFPQGNYGSWILKLDDTGSIGSCPFEGISTASVTDTAAMVIDTSVTPITSTAIVTNTTATVTDTTAVPLSVCNVPSGPERLKIGATRKKHGDGTITSLDGLIDCPDVCETFYNTDISTILTATPAPLSTFLGWKPTPSGCESTNPCTVTMDKKKSVKAIFQGPNKLKVVTTFKNGAAGAVTSGDNLIICPGDCEQTYILNAPVTITATAGAGSTFVKWTGKPCKDEATNVCTFIMDKNATVKAIFAPTS